MAGLVEEIQRDAIDARASVSTLLRKVRLAAAKLDLPRVEAWVEAELSGYDNKATLPAYRKFQGIPKIYNPMRGWIDLQAPAKFYDAVSETTTGQSVAALEELIRSDDGKLYSPMHRELIDLINSQLPVQFARMAVFIGRTEIISILDTVRNMILEWAIALEKAGIKGEGMSFKNEEKIAAHNNPAITISSVGSFVGVVGSQNSFRDIVNGSLDIARIHDLAQQLQSNHASLISAGADAQPLATAVEALIIESQKPLPNQSTVRALLGDARSALSGAAGNLIASGALSLIASILGG